MSTDHTKPDEAASIEDLPAKTSKEDASKVKGGGITPGVNANSLLTQPPVNDPLAFRGIGVRGIGFRG